MLRYIRTGCTVASSDSDGDDEQREVVAVVFEDVASVISVSLKVVKERILSAKIGKTKKIKKDFLAPTANTAVIVRKKSALGRKCCVVWLDTLPDDLQKKLRSGKFI